MLKAVQQQSLFLKISPDDADSRKFIEACNELGAEIVTSARDTTPGSEGNTLLHATAQAGCPEAVLHLIEIGHTVDCVDTSVARVTPLMVAIKAGHLEVVGLLMRSGASLYHMDIRGDNALHYGARSGSRMCKLLLKHPELTSYDYRTLLATENVKLLLPIDYAANPFIEKLLSSMCSNTVSRQHRTPKGPKKTKPQPEAEPFKAGLLKITSISLEDIINTEFFGKPDLYVVVSFGELKERLPTKTSGGSKLVWDFLNISKDVTLDYIQCNNLEISVFDENSLRSDVHIGTYSVSLGQPLAQAWTTREITGVGGELPPNSKGEATGKVSVSFVIGNSASIQHDTPKSAKKSSEEISSDREPQPEAEPFKVGLLKITSISLEDIINTEFFGKPDLYVVVSFGELKERLPTKTSGGSKLVWDFLNISKDVTLDYIQCNNLEISVFDENSLRSDVHIGTYSVSLGQPLAQAWTTREITGVGGELPPNSKGEATGKVSVSFSISETPAC